MGRRKGSKNKLQYEESEIKKDTPIFGNEKDIKREIRRLKKVKLQCRAGSKERIDLYRQIKELKDKLKGQAILDIDKSPLIAEIMAIDPSFEVLGIDLRKFSVAELQYHLNKIKERKNE